MKPIRVQLSRKKGWRMPPNTVSVARPTKWGNLFGPHNKPDSCFYTATKAEAAKVCRCLYERTFLARDLPELRGKNLACWCPLSEPCHADVLLEIANS